MLYEEGLEHVICLNTYQGKKIFSFIIFMNSEIIEN